MRRLYRECLNNPYFTSFGTKRYKCIHLDMENSYEVPLTVDLFEQVLEEEEFLEVPAGIALQSYLPESFMLLERLTLWALRRRIKGGASIHVRLVKGANLGLEKVDASLKGYPQAPFKTKIQADALFKKMLHYAAEFRRYHAVHIGVASHNVFDVAYALVLRSEKKLEHYFHFEMLEGMSPAFCHAIKLISHDMLSYCPIVKSDDFHTAIAYLMRRLDENTQPENFLAHLFNLQIKSREWEIQKEKFGSALSLAVSLQPEERRKQNRNLPPSHLEADAPFENEPDTDFSLKPNREWAEKIIKDFYDKQFEIPCVINEKRIFTEEKIQGIDPSRPRYKLYSASCASLENAEVAINAAKPLHPI